MEKYIIRKKFNPIEYWRKHNSIVKSVHMSSIKEEQLNNEQLQVLNIIKSQCRLSQFQSYENPLQLICTGSAGTGKSGLIECIIKYLESQRLLENCEFEFWVAAFTATAACRIGGQTIHSLFGLTKYSGDLWELAKDLTDPSKIHSRAVEKKSAFIKNLRFLILDEFSMVGLSMLNYMDRFLRKVHPAHSHISFGGVSVLLFGDIWQLGPVADLPLFCHMDQTSSRQEEEALKVYRSFKTVKFLKISIRQCGDPDFEKLLFRVSRRQVIQKDLELLRSRRINQLEDSSKFQDAVRVFPTNRQVQWWNGIRLAQLNQPIVRLPVIGSGEFYDICIGAEVVLVRNLWKDARLTNGAFGVVQDIVFGVGKPVNPQFPNYVLVKFHNYDGPTYEDTGAVPIVPVTEEENYKGCNITITWFPIKAAYAVTIHKIQSQTLDKLVVSIDSGEFRPGCDLVSLSRVRKLSDLAIEDQEISNKRFEYEATDTMNFASLQLQEERRLQSLAELQQ